MKKLVKNFLIFFVIFLVLAALFSGSKLFNRDSPEKVGVNYLIESINQEKLSKITVKKDELILDLKEEDKKIIKKATELKNGLFNSFSNTKKSDD